MGTPPLPWAACSNAWPFWSIGWDDTKQGVYNDQPDNPFSLRSLHSLAYTV